MEIVCLDLEGVLIPEIWIGVAEQTKIPALRATTRDVPDYDELMRQRLSILDSHGLTIDAVRDVIDDMEPIPGAVEFMGWLRTRFQVVILSDTFYEFAMPLMRPLGYPALFCHRLDVNADGRIAHYRLRMKDHKRAAVAAFKRLKFTVLAAGDSYNDTAMLAEADSGFFFRAPDLIASQFPEFPVFTDYGALGDAMVAARDRLAMTPRRSRARPTDRA